MQQPSKPPPCQPARQLSASSLTAWRSSSSLTLQLGHALSGEEASRVEPPGDAAGLAGLDARLHRLAHRRAMAGGVGGP